VNFGRLYETGSLGSHPGSSKKILIFAGMRAIRTQA
jgi:hypothetical protein